MLAALVCEYTLKKYCPEAEVIHTFDRPFLLDGDNTIHRDRWEDPCEWISTRHPIGTLFSFCRHMVPEICGFKGEAIYIDADKILFDSIKKIWDIPMGDARMLRMKNGQFAVMKMNCAGLKRYTIWTLLVDLRVSYRDLLRGRYLPEGWIAPKIPDTWNHLDRYYEGVTKLLHFTHMQSQPWVRPGHKFGYLWFDALAEAVTDGFILYETVEKEIKKQDLKKVWQAAVWPQPHCLEELRKRL